MATRKRTTPAAPQPEHIVQPIIFQQQQEDEWLSRALYFAAGVAWGLALTRLAQLFRQ